MSPAAAAAAGGGRHALPVPAGPGEIPLRRPLEADQAEAVAFVCRAGGRAYIADTPGFGKSAEVIGVAEWLARMAVTRPGDMVVVIACPASAVAVWVREILVTTGQLANVWDATGSQDVHEVRRARYHVVHYDVIHRHVAPLQALGPRLVVFDEAHRIRHPRTIAATACYQLQSPWALCVSGTPVLTGPGELFPALHYLRPDLWRSRRAFDLEYGAAKGDDPRNLGWLHADARQVVIRREKALTVPKLVRELAVTLSPAGRVRYARAEREVALARAKQKRVGYSATDVIPLERAMEDDKLRAAWALVDHRLAEGRQVILFSRWRRACQLTKARYGARCVVVDGKVRDRRVRAARVARFQRGEAQVYTGTVEANGEALTLTAADTVILLEQGWVPELARQAEDRAHRRGTPHAKVECWYVVCPGTVDDHFTESGEVKMRSTSAVTTGVARVRARERMTLEQITQIAH